MSKTKILFHILNTILIILYIYPGSILGYLIYRNFSKQPQLTSDFFGISSSKSASVESITRSSSNGNIGNLVTLDPAAMTQCSNSIMSSVPSSLT